MNNVVNIVGGASLALLASAFASSATCIGTSENGGSVNFNPATGTGLTEKGAGKACAVAIARLGHRMGADAQGTVSCSSSKCETKRGNIRYDFETNTATVIVEGHESSFSAAAYTAGIQPRDAKVKPGQPSVSYSFGQQKNNPKECNIWKGLVFQGNAPACK